MIQESGLSQIGPTRFVDQLTNWQCVIVVIYRLKNKLFEITGVSSTMMWVMAAFSTMLASLVGIISSVQSSIWHYELYGGSGHDRVIENRDAFWVTSRRRFFAIGRNRQIFAIGPRYRASVSVDGSTREVVYHSQDATNIHIGRAYTLPTKLKLMSYACVFRDNLIRNIT